MNLKLPPLTEEELGLLLTLLRTQFHSPPTESGRKAGLQAAPVEPIRRLGRAFEAHAKRNKGTYAVTDSVPWTADPEALSVAPGVNKQEALERSTREQWRRIHDELARVLTESREVQQWGFRLPVVLPSKKVLVSRPEDLILSSLAARLIANTQQYRFVPSCRYCGKAGLRARGRKENVYCSDPCKNKHILETRRKERAELRAGRERGVEITPGSIRVVDTSSNRR